MRLDADQHAGEEPLRRKAPAMPMTPPAAIRRAACATMRPIRPRRDAPRARRMHLLRALRDGVSEDAVDADSGEDDGEQGETGDEQHDEAALLDLTCDPLVHGLNVEEGLLRVDSEDGLAHGVGGWDRR